MLLTKVGVKTSTLNVMWLVSDGKNTQTVKNQCRFNNLERSGLTRFTCDILRGQIKMIYSINFWTKSRHKTAYIIDEQVHYDLRHQILHCLVHNSQVWCHQRPDTLDLTFEWRVRLGDVFTLLNIQQCSIFMSTVTELRLRWRLQVPVHICN